MSKESVKRKSSKMKSEILQNITNANLTPRELKIIEYAALGMNNKAIGRKLYISHHTVKAHLAILLKKLSAVNRTQAVYLAMKLHLIE